MTLKFLDLSTLNKFAGLEGWENQGVERSNETLTGTSRLLCVDRSMMGSDTERIRLDTNCTRINTYSYG